MKSFRKYIRYYMETPPEFAYERQHWLSKAIGAAQASVTSGIDLALTRIWHR